MVKALVFGAGIVGSNPAFPASGTILVPFFHSVLLYIY